MAGRGPRAGAWLAIAASVGIGGYGAFAARAHTSVAAMVLAFVAAAVLLALGAGLPEREAHALPAPVRGWRPRAALGCVGLAVSAILVWSSLAHFAMPAQEHGTAWFLFLAGVAVLVLSWLPWGGSRRWPSPAVTRGEILCVLLILGMAALFRFHELATMPYGVWFDEAQNCLEAIKILDRPEYRPVFVGGPSQMPAMLFYYYAFFVEILGRDVYAVRLATTFLALGSVIAVWLLGRELFRPCVGIIAAAFLAISRWHVDFSRFAIAHIATTLFIPLALFFFVRGLRRHSPRDAVFAGVVLGFGLQFYYSMITVPLMLVIFFVHRFVRGQSRSWAAAALTGLTLTSMVLSYAPVMQYAREHQVQFSRRMKRVSVIKKDSLREVVGLMATPSAERDRVLHTLGESALKHARMFHLQGDRNGRHNKPGAPMLDPVTGLFLAIGFGWCLFLAWRPACGILLIWFGAMIAPGIFSLAFEAPQGARTLGLTAVLSLMAALPVAQLSLASMRLRRSWLRRLLAYGLPVVLLTSAAADNWHTYFDVQLDDPAVWAAFATAETKIGRVIRQEGSAADIYVPQVYFNSPTQRLIAGQAPNPWPFHPGRDLPLKWHGRRAIVFLKRRQTALGDLLSRYYPHTKIEGFGAPRADGSRGAPILWIARIPAADIEALRGWVTTYRHGDSAPVERTTRQPVWEWSAAPVPAPFAAEARGVLVLSHYGKYHLRIDGTVPASLEIDGEIVLPRLFPDRTGIVLARGNHVVRVLAEISEARGETRLLWARAGPLRLEAIPARAMVAPSVPAGGLLGQYFAAPNWSGQPALEQIDPQVSLYFHVLPLPRPFSIRWVGQVFAPRSGRYSFGTSSIDASWVALDGTEIVRNNRRAFYVGGSRLLDRGWHDLELKYQNSSGHAQIYLYWTPPGGDREILPSWRLRPPEPGREGVQTAARKQIVRQVGSPRVGSLRVAESIRSGRQRVLRMAAGAGDRLLVLGSEQIITILPVDSGAGAIRLDAKETARGVFRAVSDLKFGPRGRVYLLESAGAIEVFDVEGRHLASIDIRHLGVYNPRGLAVGADGKLFIADTGHGRVLICDAKGRLLRQVARRGDGAGELSEPISVSVDGRGRITVVDAGNGRIQQFAGSGESIAIWPRPGTLPGSLSPQLAPAENGRVWVIGGHNDEVWLLPKEPAGKVEVFSAANGGAPTGGATDSKGNLFLFAAEGGQILRVARAGTGGSSR